MTAKETVIEAIRDLPEDSSLDQIVGRVEFLAAVEKGIAQLDQGKHLSHDEVKKQLASWLTA